MSRILRGLLIVLVSAFCLGGTLCAQQIIAHRGASYDAPENTLAAFRLAWEQQADGIEGDFYLTKDGQIACIHDETTKRTAPGQRELSVAESNLAELQALDVGRWKDLQFAGERIPTLEQVLETVPDHGVIFVEIKCGPEILPIIEPVLAECGLRPEQIVMICFNREVVAQARQRMPQYHANWLTSFKQEPKGSLWKPRLPDVLSTLRATGATGLGSQGELAVIDAAFVEAVCAQGEEFHVWTINDAQVARTFQALGAKSITTDRPAYLRKALEIDRVE